ncbi:MAG: hypothetical protein IJW86_02195 [Clostridia bacterium]|nr:hypothetical protein [Clostridia bacterium]
MKKISDCDNFVVGNKEQTELKSFGYNIPKVCEYLKETGKRFEDLSAEELDRLK